MNALSRGAESWYGCSDSDSGSDSDPDSDSGTDTKYNINNTLMVQSVQAKKEPHHFLFGFHSFAEIFILVISHAYRIASSSPQKEVRLPDHLFVQIMFRLC